MNDERLGLPSASKRERWSACPGSFGLEKLMPETASGEAAEKGNRIHEALALGNFSELVLEEAEVAERLAILEKVAVAEWLNAINCTAVQDVVREKRMSFSVSEEKLLTGKPDVVYYSKNSILVLDYKTGSVLVDSVGNPQLRALAVMASNRSAVVGEATQSAFTAVLQDGQAVVLEQLSESGISMEAEKLLNELHRLQSQTEVRVVGSHCQYCRASGVCPEAQGATRALAQVGPKHVYDVAGMPKLLESCIIAEAVVEAVKKRARELLGEGVPIAGWKLQTQNRRYLSDAPEALNRLAEVVGMTKAISVADISISGAEELIMANEQCNKKKASERIGSLLQDLIELRPIQKLTRSK